MNRQEVLERVVYWVQDQVSDTLPEGKEPRKVDLFTDMGFDSLDVVELVMALEDEYQIKMPDDEVHGRMERRTFVGTLRTIGEFTDLVCKKLGI